MKYIKYFFQFLIIIIIFFIFKLIGPKISSMIGGKLFEKIGPLFRSKKIIHSNIEKAFSEIDLNEKNNITKMMWNNYGRIFAEYIFIKKFKNENLNSNIEIKGQEILDEIKKIINLLYLFLVICKL